MSSAKTIGLAQIGVGYWGKNLFRNFNGLSDATMLQVCDQNEEVLNRLKKQNPDLSTTKNFDDLLTNKEVDAIIIATQTPLHYEFARAALEAGKHVFVEKPLAQSVEQAEHLVNLAETNDVRLMVGHLLLYHQTMCG